MVTAALELMCPEEIVVEMLLEKAVRADLTVGSDLIKDFPQAQGKAQVEVKL